MEGLEYFSPEGQEGFTPEGPRISDLISSEYTCERDLANCRFTSLSSELRSGRIHEGNTTKAKLRITYYL